MPNDKLPWPFGRWRLAHRCEGHRKNLSENGYERKMPEARSSKACSDVSAIRNITFWISMKWLPC
jgi:hypothetical protein